MFCSITHYVLPDGTSMEHIITFLSNTGYKGENLIEAVTTLIESLGLNSNNYKGQSYDNASNMSGCYTGLYNQELLKWTLSLWCPMSLVQATLYN